MRMRVISQNGAMDVPYELTAFHVCNGLIRMNMAGDVGRGTEMAVYGNQEKALDVMKSLRALHNEIKLMEIRGDGGAFIENTFRFPADDEVRT